MPPWLLQHTKWWKINAVSDAAITMLWADTINESRYAFIQLFIVILLTVFSILSKFSRTVYAKQDFIFGIYIEKTLRKEYTFFYMEIFCNFTCFCWINRLNPDIFIEWEELMNLTQDIVHICASFVYFDNGN